MLGALVARLRRSQRGGARFEPGASVVFINVVGDPLRVVPDKPYVHNVASTRLRLLIPARELARQVPVWIVPLPAYLERAGGADFGRVGAVVLGKFTTRDALQYAEPLRTLLARAGSPPLYADVSDDYAALAREMREPFLAEYQRLLGRAGTLVVPTATLAAAVARDARRGVTVIEDPYETPERPARLVPGEPLRLGWFGNLGSVNAPALQAAFETLAGALGDLSLELEIVADPRAQPLVQRLADALRARHARCSVAFTPWSMAATEAVIERCDLVVLPQEHATRWGQVKSHNRLVAAIRGGRFALASPIPSYLELKDYAWVGEDLVAGLRWALANPAEAAQRVAAGQRYVAQRFAPEVIGRRWAEVLGIEPVAG